MEVADSKTCSRWPVRAVCVPSLHDTYLLQILAGQRLLSVSRSSFLGVNQRSGQINKAVVPGSSAGS